MKKNQTKIFLVLLIAALPLLGFGCKFSQSSEVKELYQPIELSWWGVWEDSADVAAIIEAYETIHPNITITYRKFRFEEYEEELTKAWLEQRGPDIFSIPADAIREYQNLIEPMPTIMKLPYVETTGTIKKEQTIVVKQVAGLTAKKVQELFVDAVANTLL
jgi:ABC-type glycerol-3-phosphate transport system substrate-binding protein